MANMSYCRFQNTLEDLRDCHEHMDDELENEAEGQARAKLLKLCMAMAIAAEHGHEET